MPVDHDRGRTRKPLPLSLFKRINPNNLHISRDLFLLKDASNPTERLVM
jgi:hypothetical protein